MGLSMRSTGIRVACDFEEKIVREEKEFIITLAGNPNVGKSTVFNSLTGLNQHTGNWPGKTVVNARGECCWRGNTFILVDVPGTYSMLSDSDEEQVARNFIFSGSADATIIVVDATCLERNLNLVLQVLELTPFAVVCVNLMDEAERKKIRINLRALEQRLGVPVVGTNARNRKGFNELLEAVYGVASRKIKTNPLKISYAQPIEQAVMKLEECLRKRLATSCDSRWLSLRLLEGDTTLLEDLQNKQEINLHEDTELLSMVEQEKAVLVVQGIHADAYRDRIVSAILFKAEEIAGEVVSCMSRKYNRADRKIDKIVTSRIFGIPIMLALLALIFWITVSGANYPSQWIASGFSWLETKFSAFFIFIKAPSWVHDMLVLGMYRTLAWVVSVMLPPMAIFFPLFTLLEDLGYLPRVAFNLDNFFKKACAHGKQALTMCMGFGCNAAGVIGCRIINSPRERLIAILTNNFVPCNGRFPTLIAISAIFFGIGGRVFLPTLVVTGLVLVGILMTLLMSKLLSKTLLKGVASSFTLELPPYRKPQVGRILVRSVFDRTLFVLGRAVSTAIPAGVVIWIMANTGIGGVSLLTHSAEFLEPFARLIGMDGYILMAFLLGLPANEIVLPIILMSYLSAGNMIQYESLAQLGEMLRANGWTEITAICVMVFSLMHFPCATTMWTIRKETRSLRWTLLSFLLPTLAGIAVCFTITLLSRV